MSERVAVVGLGYVGLPVALAAARQFEGTVGFDINETKVASLRNGVDPTGEVASEVLRATSLRMTADPKALGDATFIIVAVPTPVDGNNQPDLSPVIGASRIVGKYLRPGAVVVFESTVYPGVTEEICGGVLARESGLAQGTDFKLGYSPERINPGDREHTFERIVKIVSAEDPETLDRVAAVYGAMVPAGVYRAPSIRVAEAAKVIENTQRDLNIALMNELALIFDRMGIETRAVIDAAKTKWNFLPFVPGLVGGHCIGVDPYYLTTKAQQLGYLPEVILAGRRINNNMGSYIAQRFVKMLIHAKIQVREARVGILGLTFKENVSDIRNSKVPDIRNELLQFGIEPLVHDPCAKEDEARHEYGIGLAALDAMRDLDGLIIAVNHKQYRDIVNADTLRRFVRAGGVVVDLKWMLDRAVVPQDIAYWAM